MLNVQFDVSPLKAIYLFIYLFTDHVSKSQKLNFSN